MRLILIDGLRRALVPRGWVLLAAILPLVTGCANSASPGKAAAPTAAATPADFTHDMASHLRQSLPGVTVTEQGPLTLNLQSADGHQITANLDRLYNICSQQAPDCGAMTDRFTAASAEVLKSATPPSASQLRLVVRAKSDLDAAQTAIAGNSNQQPIAQPLAGDLWQVLVLDYPNSLRYATQHDLDSLKLTSDAAIAQAMQNLAGSLPPLATVTHDLGAHQIGVIQGNAYDASRVLMAKDWAKVAQNLDGRLLVAVPASDTVLYSEDNGVQSVRAFAVLAQATASKAEHAVSPALLRWTPTGWQTVVVP